MLILVTGILLICGIFITHSVVPITQKTGSSGLILTIISVISGIALIIVGMLTADFIVVWYPPFWAIIVPVIVMPLVFILLIAAIFPTKIRRNVQHPVLLGVFLWSGAHLTINGDLASIILFGSFALFSLLDIWIRNRRNKPKRTVKKQITDPFLQELVSNLKKTVLSSNQAAISFDNIVAQPKLPVKNLERKNHAGQSPVYYDKRAILIGIVTFVIVLFTHSYLFSVLK